MINENSVNGDRPNQMLDLNGRRMLGVFMVYYGQLKVISLVALESFVLVLTRNQLKIFEIH